MVGPAPAPRLVMSYGIYNSPLSLETIASEEGDKGCGLGKNHPNQGIVLGIPTLLWEILQFENWYNSTGQSLEETDASNASRMQIT